MTEPILLADKINTYYDQSHILRGVDFRVMPRETVSLLGRNGMGKTTLLRTLMGLVAPRTGSVRLKGANITGERASLSAKAGLAFIPEDRGIFPNLTVLENLTFAARSGGAAGIMVARQSGCRAGLDVAVCAHSPDSARNFHCLTGRRHDAADQNAPHWRPNRRGRPARQG